MTMTGSQELFATFYLVIVLSLVYVDVALTIFASVLAIVLHTILIVSHRGNTRWCSWFSSRGSLSMFRLGSYSSHCDN